MANVLGPLGHVFPTGRGRVTTGRLAVELALELTEVLCILEKTISVGADRLPHFRVSLLVEVWVK